MTDIKQTLETAFDGEPPLTIDLPKIMKTGKRRVAVRRVAAGVAVLATATVVCVPAMLGSSGGGSNVVAASGPTASEPAVTLTTTAPPTSPPGTTPSSTITTSPGATVQSMPRPQPPRPVTEERARQLTALLQSSGAIPADAQGEPIPQDPQAPWEFQVSGNDYRVVMNVTSPAGRGMVLIYVTPGEAPKCEGCEVVRQPDGREVFVHTSRYNGIELLLADVAIPGGRVHVQVSNSTDKTVGAGDRPLTVEQAVKLAAIPGLTF